MVNLATTTTFELIKIYLYAGDIRLIHLLLVLMVIDILTGIGKGIMRRKLYTPSMYNGGIRKLAIFGIIILANVMDQMLHLNGAVLSATMIFYMALEGLSILENAAQMGVKFPGGLHERLKVIADEKRKSDIIEQVTDKLSKTDKINATVTADITDLHVDTAAKPHATKKEEVK